VAYRQRWAGFSLAARLEFNAADFVSWLAKNIQGRDDGERAKA